MKFRVDEPRILQNFTTLYRADDCSFDIEPYNMHGFTSLSINTLQLEIDDDCTVLYVWGLCPFIIFEETNEFPSHYTPCTLVALLDIPLTPGVSIGINNDDWPVYVNKKKGWGCLGNPTTKGDQMVEFAPNCVAVLENQEMRAVWLHPEGFPWPEKSEAEVGFFKRMLRDGFGR